MNVKLIHQIQYNSTYKKKKDNLGEELFLSTERNYINRTSEMFKPVYNVRSNN